MGLDLPLINNLDFPPNETALDDPNGLLAFGGDLSPQRLALAYRLGIFPWFGDNEPILWWSPDPRCIILPKQLKISRSLKKSIKNKGYRCTADQAFEPVINACSGKRFNSPGTWITNEMKSAYIQMHELKIARSVEIWKDETLVGGLYGLCMGPFFFGESMFSLSTDASKVALVYLMSNLVPRGLVCVDCQVENPHLMSLGANLIPRENFCDLLDQNLPAKSEFKKSLYFKSIWPEVWQEDINLP